jgi:hypothetical protein
MEKDKSILAIIKRHYMITLILPFITSLNLLISRGLMIENEMSFFYQSLDIFIIGTLILFCYKFLFFLLKWEVKVAFSLLLIPFFTMFFFTLFFDNYGINEDTIHYRLNKKKLLKIIEKSNSIAQDGKGKLIKIPMNGTYIGCDKYLIYDESDQIISPNGNFRNIDYVNIYNKMTDKVDVEKAYSVRSYLMEKHIYIVHFCLDTGQ